MNLFLRPLDNVTDPVWSVIISILIFLLVVSYYIYTIMDMAFEELKDVQPNQSERCEPGSGDSTPETQN